MSLVFVRSGICKQCLKKLRTLRCHTYTTETRQKWSSKEIRKSFLDYYCEQNGHQFVKSSSVIPPKDSGSYFTNSGMNQFKPIFQGTVEEGSEMSKYKKVANSQKCIRVGGKHNDLEEVGKDLTHHTFFEMLGNWSFGATDKEEACRLALNLLLRVYDIPEDRLYFTYFEGDSKLGILQDIETRTAWRKLGVPASRIIPLGVKDNFWDMGDVGPCGRCTEIHYHHGGENLVPYKVFGHFPEMVELMNLVFIQYERKRNGALTKLPHMHVDVGMGLERLCAVMNEKLSNYDTDLFIPIMDAIHKLTGAPAYQGLVGTEAVVDQAYRIIADHIRMVTVCISDGLLPGSHNQESKLRTVIYRALYRCNEVLKADPGLLPHLVDVVVDSLGDVYPEIARNEKLVKEVLRGTEQNYRQLSLDGKRNFEKLLKKHPDIKELNGELLKRLQDGWYGHPMSLEMVEIMAGLYGIKINEEDLSQMQKEKQVQIGGQLQIAPMFPWLTEDILEYLQLDQAPATDDSMKYQYEHLEDGSYEFPDCEGIIVHLLDKENNFVASVGEGDIVGVIMDKTNFYAQKGGQRGDKGLITTETGTVLVNETHSDKDHVLHIGTVTEGEVETSQEAILTLDVDFRQGCMRNHTATHLLNMALRHVLGDDVRQKASYVSHDKLTFDFSSVKPVTNEGLKEIEEMVNSFIQKGVPLQRELRPFSNTMKEEGIIYLDNVDYPPEVHVVQFDESVPGGIYKSTELCAGTHVLNTSDIGSFCVTGFTGMAVYGTKDTVCLTGPQAQKAIQRGEEARKLISELEEALESDMSLDHCLDLQKQIGSLNYEEMPKLVRQEVRSRTEDAHFTINTLVNKQAYTQLKQDLHTIMLNDEAYGVHHMVMKVIPKITKIMKSQTFTKPFILVVDTTNNTSAYVCLPKVLEDSREALVNKFKDTVDGVVSLSEDRFDIVKKGGKNTDLFMDSAEKVLSEFSETYYRKET